MAIGGRDGRAATAAAGGRSRGRKARPNILLPLLPALGATVALCLLIGLEQPAIALAEVAATIVVAIVSIRRRPAPRRIAVLGSRTAAEALLAELGRAATSPQLIGRIAPAPPGRPDRRWLGDLADLRGLVQRYEIDLLLLCRGVPRMEVFDELDRSCADLPVRLCELSWFYEAEFGQVPIAEIDSAWLQCLLHPAHDPRLPRTKRAADVVLSVVAGALAAPLLAVLALMIRRDGGPALYRQVRIGEGGRPFTMLKLRTMRHVMGVGTQWTTPDDDRVTPIGALLRRTHIDELPQVLNVLRGDMSIVGPRPEQPSYVRELEKTIPFYSRRHQLRPGLTGWAQVRCGYSGSRLGTAWKLSYDLYYLKHRCLRLDVMIMLETLRTPFSRNQFPDPERQLLVLGHAVTELTPDAAPVAVAPQATEEAGLAAAGGS